ncbi:recombinase family protein [Phaeobacter gallaeciensis]|uniref:Site-specific recombinase, DNA invertase Pin-like protein n=1 Tax=Phaeobacter gallaeciensis TaxID=60890 RepID=A0AAC9Z882_9RHOB|nr:recombinase family protein [Phaeobacter gallaeciensis]AHD09498.1 Site-specific recombinase, DNA invertase Pin-like protein [Phaeobacter gallaeciensis DSM 26640]ATE92761.1 Site-specific recombinase, DNA invertase Pin-like protein [Phaeobacter gallaeciensis]ATE97417.1 Site-specific recombinase, DNA invertase Pin-like protein [Phaeobacter gallaeciensis]ATF01426.1 Site-specific recombinase, DNA invertase Pin-like protein [Phaeobacter gallaeciensis]ATF05806.1 Site-specific recombinase, DNA inver
MTKPEPVKVGYARVSTIEQNLDMQITALKQYGVTDAMIFTDKMSGAKTNRPGLQAAISTAAETGGEFVVWKLDRLGRTLLGIIGAMQVFEANDVLLVSLTERFDLTSPMGKGMFHIMAALAQMERDLIRERTIAGVKAARERGSRHGRPQTMTPERIEKAAELALAGVSATKIIPVMKAMPGPSIAKSRVYQWVREFKAQQGMLTSSATRENAGWQQ